MSNTEEADAEAIRNAYRLLEVPSDASVREIFHAHRKCRDANRGEDREVLAQIDLAFERIKAAPLRAISGAPAARSPRRRTRVEDAIVGALCGGMLDVVIVLVDPEVDGSTLLVIPVILTVAAVALGDAFHRMLLRFLQALDG